MCTQLITLVKRRGFTYRLDKERKTVWILKGHIKRGRRYRIPSRVEIEGVEYIVESVEAGAYKVPSTLRHLVIPDEIQYVDEYNFSTCKGLRSVYIGKGLEHLSSWIFHMNPRMNVFEIAKENPYLCIKNGIVYSKDMNVVVCCIFNLRKIEIPEGVKSIMASAFWWNPKLEEVSFPSSLRVIGDNSLSGCQRLKRLVIPEGFEEFVVQSLQHNESLEYVDLPSTMKELGYETFFDCPNIKTFIIRTEFVLEAESSSAGDFDFVPHCTLYVPENLVPLYRTHPLWCRCASIRSIESMNG